MFPVLPDPPADLDPRGSFFVGFPLRPPSPVPRERWPAAPSILRFLDPQDLHFTIAFFGALTAEQIVMVRGCLTELVVTPAVEASTSDLRLMPNRRRPSVVAWEIGVGRRELAERIEELREPLCRAAGIPCEKRPALPHLTVARLPRSLSHRDLDELRDWLTYASAIPPQALILGAPCLFGRSRNHPTPRYAKFPSI